MRRTLGSGCPAACHAEPPRQRPGGGVRQRLKVELAEDLAAVGPLVASAGPEPAGYARTVLTAVDRCQKVPSGLLPQLSAFLDAGKRIKVVSANEKRIYPESPPTKGNLEVELPVRIYKTAFEAERGLVPCNPILSPELPSFAGFSRSPGSYRFCKPAILARKVVSAGNRRAPSCHVWLA